MIKVDSIEMEYFYADSKDCHASTPLTATKVWSVLDMTMWYLQDQCILQKSNGLDFWYTNSHKRNSYRVSKFGNDMYLIFENSVSCHQPNVHQHFFLPMPGPWVTSYAYLQWWWVPIRLLQDFRDWISKTRGGCI